ncbi:MAG TPA: hypothetical protein VK498_01230 [Ferruginibacter sp.]|nr:hypothetical protein [Ferruginibacter sp.]
MKHSLAMALQPHTIQDNIDQADEAVTSGDLATAIKLYNRALEQNPLSEYIYSRLMILYRKEKDFKNELRVINAGIKAYEHFYKPKGKSRSRLVTTLSNKLNKLVGLIDKKGKFTYDPEPLAKWKKRKEIVRKKIK